MVCLVAALVLVFSHTCKTESKQNEGVLMICEMRTSAPVVALAL